MGYLVKKGDHESVLSDHDIREFLSKLRTGESIYVRKVNGMPSYAMSFDQRIDTILEVSQKLAWTTGSRERNRLMSNLKYHTLMAVGIRDGGRSPTYKRPPRAKGLKINP